MKYILAVDTATAYVVSGVVGVDESTGEPHTVAQRMVDNPRGHMEMLTPQIVDCLQEAQLQPSDLAAVVVGTGPGPFTGLRVGMATGQAFADALSIPVHGVESTAAIAVNHGGAPGDRTRWVITDARRREWYWAAYRVSCDASGTCMGLDTVAPPAVSSPDSVAEAVQRISSEHLEEQRELLATKEVAAAVGVLLGPVAHEDAQPSPLSLVTAALLRHGGMSASALRALLSAGAAGTAEATDATGTGGAQGEPLRALYLRRPDAIEPKSKPVSAALDFSAVGGSLRLDTSGEDDGANEANAANTANANSNTASTSASTADTTDPQLSSAEVTLVALDTSAAAEIAEIEQDLFAGDSPWPLSGIRAELAAVNTTYFGLREPYGELIGYLGLAKNGPLDDPEWEIHTVAVDTEYQGRGLSRILMDAALELVDRAGGPVFLEVRTDNEPAVGLYRRYGFDVTGVRKGYYQPSGADAYTMMRPDVRAQRDDAHDDANDGADNAGDSATRPLIILGVESSCDETGVGIVELHRPPAGDDHTSSATARVVQVSNRVASSMEQHARFGGVVPEIASRAHLEAMGPTMRAALSDLQQWNRQHGSGGQDSSWGTVKPDAVAATIGPGLAGALLVGAAAAKAYAAAWGVPFYGVNHLGGHVAVDLIEPPQNAARAAEGEAGVASEETTAGAAAPGAQAMDNAIALLVSGGHTQILHVRGVGHPMEELGSTVDDAAGEAYDKVARLLGLGYPGGPVIDRLAAQGNPRAIAFPRGMMRPQDARYDFSFSGLKTAVARYVEKAEREAQQIPVEDVCASFQEAVCDVLTAKAVRAAQDKGASTMLLGGGVSANSRLRQLLAQRCGAAGIELHIPEFALCTDNGVMVAALAAQLIAAGGKPSGLDVGTDPGLEVEIPLV